MAILAECSVKRDEKHVDCFIVEDIHRSGFISVVTTLTPAFFRASATHLPLCRLTSRSLLMPPIRTATFSWSDGGELDLERIDRIFYFQISISSSSSTLNCFLTFSLTMSINFITSLLVHPFCAIKKLACFSLTIAPPTCKPFKPVRSIIAPADIPRGFLKMQPELIVFNG